MVKSLNHDVSHFEEVSQACETFPKGDKSALKELENQLSSIDKKIAGASAGVGVSGGQGGGRGVLRHFGEPGQGQEGAAGGKGSTGRLYKGADRLPEQYQPTEHIYPNSRRQAGRHERRVELPRRRFEAGEKMLSDGQRYTEMPTIVQGYFETAVKQWAALDKDIGIVKEQMAGVVVKNLPK